MSQGFSIDHDISAGLGPQSSGDMYASEAPHASSEARNQTESKTSKNASERSKERSAALSAKNPSQHLAKRTSLPTPEANAAQASRGPAKGKNKKSKKRANPQNTYCDQELEDKAYIEERQEFL